MVLLEVPIIYPNAHANIKENPEYAFSIRSHIFVTKSIDTYMDERKSEQAHIPHAPTLLENAVYNEWQFQALVTSNRTKISFI